MSRLRSRTRAAALAAALLVAAGCEDTPVVAPTDGQIIVSANPGNVIIDSGAGETTGRSTITARVLDAKGLGVVNATVYFTAEAGTLDSSDNSCVALRCRSTGDLCVTTADCTPISPVGRETDPNGFVSDVLTVAVADPSSVKVNVTSGKLAQSVTVTKTVTQGGNVAPVARFVITPADEQCADDDVAFNASTSDDPDGAITCYQWTIDSSLNTRDEVVQGPARDQFTRSYTEGQSLVVALRVSDDTNAATFCVDCGPCPLADVAASSNFNSSVATQAYGIVLDGTAPTADAGPDQTLTLNVGSVSASLSGAATDPESSIVSYSWNCGNSQAAIASQNATCTYTAAQQFTATLTVVNACGLSGTDEAKITVTAGTP